MGKCRFHTSFRPTDHELYDHGMVDKEAAFLQLFFPAPGFHIKEPEVLVFVKIL
jgi:hypothetical protein